MKKPSISKLVSTFGLVMAFVGWCASAQAYTFGFEDVAYIGSAASFTSTFNPSGGPTYHSNQFGYWQVLTTNNGQNWSGSAPPTPTYVFHSSLGEFIQNDPINTSGIQGTEGWDKLALNNWTATTTSGQIVHYVSTRSTGASFDFQGPTGISQAVPFTFNSFDLGGTVGQVVTFVGRDASNNVLDTATVTLGSTFQTFTENWTGVSSVAFTSLGGGAINMDNVRLNDPTVTPEPGTMLLLGTGMVGLLGFRKRFKNA